MDDEEFRRPLIDQERLLSSGSKRKRRFFCFLRWSTSLLAAVGSAFLFIALLALMSRVIYREIFGPAMSDSGCEKDASLHCEIRIVESIPEGLVFNGSSVENLSTFEAWKKLLNLTEVKLELASSYWSLRGQDVYEDPSDWQGEYIFEHLLKGK